MHVEQIKTTVAAAIENPSWRHVALGGVAAAVAVAPLSVYGIDDANAQPEQNAYVSTANGVGQDILRLQPQNCAGNKQYKSRIIFHRGVGPNGLGSIDEDTPTSARWAEQNGAGAAETDSQMTKDSKNVVLHNPTLNDATNLSGDVSHYTLDQLQQNGRYNHGGAIASNRDWYKAMANSCMKAWMELKPDGITQEGVMDSIQAADDIIADPSRVTFTSSGIGILCRVNKLSDDEKQDFAEHPTAKIETTNGWPNLAKIKQADCGIDGVNVVASAITPARIKAAHNAGLYVSAREVESMKQVAHLNKMGVKFFVIDPNGWTSSSRNKLVHSKLAVSGR